jgi:hypothetical protein
MIDNKQNVMRQRRIFTELLISFLFFILPLYSARAQANLPEAQSVNSLYGLSKSSSYPDTNYQKKSGELDSVMYNYLFVITKKDTEKFLGFFSTEKTFKFTTYISGKKKKPASFVEVKFKKLRFDIENRIGLFDDFFEYDPEDYNYRSSIIESPFEKWKRQNNTYKIEDDWNIYYVTWITEGDKWVIKEIAYTQPY